MQIMLSKFAHPLWPNTLHPVPAPTPIPFSAAHSAIRAALAALPPSSPTRTIGITGPVGSGKSTLARALEAPIVPSDHYLPDYTLVSYLDRDDPAFADLPLLAQHLTLLRRGQSARIPIWSFHTHRREGTTLIDPAPLIICEGIHALHPTIRPHLDLAIYVDAPANTRWARWENLERTGQRGWGIDHAHQHFNEVAEPTFNRWANQYQATADILVVNAG